MIFFLEEYSLCFQLRNPIITLPQFQGTYFGDSITKADEYARRKARWVGVFVPRSQRKSTLLSLSVALLPLKKQREQVAELFQKVFVFYYFFMFCLFSFLRFFLRWRMENSKVAELRPFVVCSESCEGCQMGRFTKQVLGGRHFYMDKVLSIFLVSFLTILTPRYFLYWVVELILKSVGIIWSVLFFADQTHSGFLCLGEKGNHAWMCRTFLKKTSQSLRSECCPERRRILTKFK